MVSQLKDHLEIDLILLIMLRMRSGEENKRSMQNPI